MARRGNSKWIPGGFFDNFAAAADAVGFENADLAWGLARVQWRGVEDREKFLSLLTSQRSRDLAAVPRV